MSAIEIPHSLQAEADGARFCLVTFENSDKRWAYDLETQIWHEQSIE